jgi:hypothetical protein
MVKDALAANVCEELQDREVAGLSYAFFYFHRLFPVSIAVLLARLVPRGDQTMNAPSRDPDPDEDQHGFENFVGVFHRSIFSSTSRPAQA